MRYDEIRHEVQDHFRGLLEQFKGEIDAKGPPEDRDLMRMTEAAKFQSSWNWDDLVNVTGAQHAAATISDACARLGVQEDHLTAGTLQQLQRDILDGHSAYSKERLSYIQGLNRICLHNEANPNSRSNNDIAYSTKPTQSFSDVSEQYFRELRHTNQLAAKTEASKREALALLCEITDNKPVPAMTKADAQKFKQILMKLPCLTSAPVGQI